MTIGVLKEPSFETRVSLLPDAVASLTKKGIKVFIESDAGLSAFSTNSDYEKAGGVIAEKNAVVNASEVLLSLQTPETNSIKSGSGSPKILIGVYQPLFNQQLMKDWAAANISCFSLDMLPRTTRAQSMDVLSSQANIAGYKSVLLAANLYSRYFPMFMTAAGSIAPAKLLILGAGVAGLQAVATARRLGAVVEVFDTRPAVKEEVMSLGAKFVEVEGAADASKAGGYAVEQSPEFIAKQKARIAESIAKSDIVITTAQIPGKKAPILITTEMITAMRSGSVIIDIAAATGGNTELTKNNETVLYNGISIVGNSALAASMPADASKLYGKNVMNFLQLITDKEGNVNLNWEDDLVKGACITNDGKIVNDRVNQLLQ
ncbi:MAG: Re/Si-specific NAD(P)(+) transhydrogenase subunit alpha [Chitinophagaceae bacterium]|nr:Re/Si-specific NAD(P)(+) transhydrogenase subunit alpha [Chitinophagaceae bacterium]